MNVTHPVHWFAASYVLLALSVAQRSGSYTPGALALALCAFAAACAGGWLLARGRSRGEVSPVALGVALMALLLIGLDVSPLMGDKNIRVDRVVHTGAWLLIGFAAAAYVLNRIPARQRRQLAWTFIAMGLALRAAAPWLSPSPVIDVFTMSQESAAHVLEGKNPYETPVTDPYGGNRPDLRPPDTYAYPPAALVLQLPGFVFLRDVRYASVLGDLAVACTLLWLLRKKPAIAELLALLFLWHPRGPLVVELAWTEPLIALGLCAWLWLHHAGRRTAAAAVFGLVLGIKQYLVLFALHWLRVERSMGRIAIALGTIALVMIPFILWGPEAFWQNAILFQLQNPFRPDSLTLASGLGLTPGRGWSLLVGLAATAATMSLFKKLPALTAMLAGLTLTMFTAFLFGAQAFCNYYYLVWVLLLLTMAQVIRDDETAGAPL